ncbi:hypothetical protein RFI_03292, partial [Reticulomyxa filosa]
MLVSNTSTSNLSWTNLLEYCFDYDEYSLDLFVELESTEHGEYVYGQKERLCKTGEYPVPLPISDGFKQNSVVTVGVLTSINRVFFAVERTLYFWNYTAEKKWNSLKEFDSVVTCVGVVTPKPDVFLNEIQHVLIIATETEVALIAIEFADGVIDNDMQAHATRFKTATKGAQMKRVTATRDGRIFLGSEDGSVWEFDYYNESPWLGTSQVAKSVLRNVSQSKTSKVFEYVGNIVLPLGLLPALAQRTAVTDLVVSENINNNKWLFVLHKESRSKDCERLAANNTRNEMKPTVIKLHALGAGDNTSAHLCAITNQGDRIYLALLGDRHYYGLEVRCVRMRPLQSRLSFDLADSKTEAGSKSKTRFRLGEMRNEAKI